MSDEDFVMEDEVEAAPQPSPAQKATVDQLKKIRPMTRIILEENDEIPAVGLFLGHNGNGFLLKPGMPVDVPNEILGILNDAVMSSPVIDPETKAITGWRQRMRYGYRVLPPNT